MYTVWKVEKTRSRKGMKGNGWKNNHKLKVKNYIIMLFFLITI